jgi:DNA-binding CsgD family transcriptional regulator
VLLGRTNECQVIEALLAASRKGQGGAIVVLGEPGIGKTALLEHAATSAHEITVLRTVGSEAEKELAYASLQDLFRPTGGAIAQLPEPQKRAIEIVFGRSVGQAPDPLLVGLGLLNLLSELSAECPVLCVIDDAQWLDAASAQVISFAARHISHDAVAFLFGARTLIDELRGLPALNVAALGDHDARHLLATVLPDRLDDRVVDRLVAETHGNPLAILEMPRGLTPSQLAGGFGLPASVTLAGQIEESYRRRLAKLPPESKRLLLIAAADPTGNSELVWRAMDILRIPEDAVEAVEDGDFVELQGRIVFRHPIVRSAIYNTATPKERRAAHAALADATDIDVDPDRRAWHQAQATIRPNEAVAAELERSALRAQARGGFAAAGAFLERSMALTVDPTLRAIRALRAAQAKRLSGALDAATGLAAIAETGPIDDLHGAELDILLGQIAFARSRDNEVASRMLQAASRLERVDVGLAREAYLDALIAALFSSHLAVDAGAQMVAKAASAVERPEGAARGSDVLLDGLALFITAGYRAGTPVLKEAVTLFQGDGICAEERLRWSGLAGGTAGALWDYETWDTLTARQETLARDVGALSLLPDTLGARVGVSLFAGDLARADLLVEQIQVVTDASDIRRFPYAALSVAGFRGDEQRARELVETTNNESIPRGEGLATIVSSWALAVLSNGRGHYEEAFRAAKEATKDPNELWYWGWGAVEFIEAASRTNNASRAQPAFERLVESTDASGTDWALAVQARCRALLADGLHAEVLYCEALERLEPTRLRLDLARTRLLYGEWLRRAQRQREAREQLRLAHGLFVEFGMSGFADRAESELLATGERARKRKVETRLDLTPQELRISELAADGATNQEIAGQLFISTATVEYHLSKVYRKLGIRSRTQLVAVLQQKGPMKDVPEFAGSR